ncbi:MAG: DUF2262 domain-containing protein [Deltaproteobacteria bacterium]|nr:DUF2262 domain-containing protein [Deltaproteobacteria bacterium]
MMLWTGGLSFKKKMKLADFKRTSECIEGTVDGKPKKSELISYTATIPLWGAGVNVTFRHDKTIEDLNQFVSSLSLMTDWISQNKKLIEDHVVSDMLSLKNDVWLDDDEDPLSTKQFLSSIRPADMLVSADGSVELFFDAGDLFFGHQIEVYILTDKTMDPAHLAG